jgi:hypothetical protein
MHIENWIEKKDQERNREESVKLRRLSRKERTVDALALGAEEGRNEHRNALGSCK